jgi:hypothetical protein
MKADAMALSGDDIEKLSKALVSALDDVQLAAFVHASTGNRLYDQYVGHDKPLMPTIRELLNCEENRRGQKSCRHGGPRNIQTRSGIELPGLDARHLGS